MPEKTYPFQHVINRNNNHTQIICENRYYRAECTYQDGILDIYFTNQDPMPPLVFTPANTQHKAHVGFVCESYQIAQLTKYREQSVLFEAIDFQNGLIDLLRKEINPEII